MKVIQLTQGRFTTVDDEDFIILTQWKWYAYKHGDTFYAVRSIGSGENKKTILMHRVILGLTDSKIEVDHEDHNGLHNCKSNLRIATRANNMANVTSAKNSSSKYLGVSLNKSTNTWRAKIKNKHLGYFKDPKDAAIAYNQAAIKNYGEFANLNVI